MYPGTSGGHGGLGGTGGRGGGAAGGASIGVLTVNARATVAADTAITLGQGGQFGIGGHNGWQGVAQKTAQVTTAGGTQPGSATSTATASTTPPTPARSHPARAPDARPTRPAAGGDRRRRRAATGGAGPVTVSVLPPRAAWPSACSRVRINARRAHLKSARLTLDGHRSGS